MNREGGGEVDQCSSTVFTKIMTFILMKALSGHTIKFILQREIMLKIMVYFIKFLQRSSPVV